MAEKDKDKDGKEKEPFKVTDKTAKYRTEIQQVSLFVTFPLEGGPGTYLPFFVAGAQLAFEVLVEGVIYPGIAAFLDICLLNLCGSGLERLPMTGFLIL